MFTVHEGHHQRGPRVSNELMAVVVAAVIMMVVVVVVVVGMTFSQHTQEVRQHPLLFLPYPLDPPHYPMAAAAVLTSVSSPGAETCCASHLYTPLWSALM